MLRQFEDMEKAIQNSLDEQGLELDFEPGEDFKAEETADRRKPRKDDALVSAADEYLKRARQFLKANFYDKKLAEPELSADFDTVNWYHTLLTVKLQRALNGFDDLDADEDFALYDTVAQFAVCQKAIKESIQALRNIQPYYPEQKIIFVQFLALLSNVSHRIQKLEESI